MLLDAALLVCCSSLRVLSPLWSCNGKEMLEVPSANVLAQKGLATSYILVVSV